jgi:transposase
LPHAIAVTTADVSDRHGALKTIEQNLEGLAEVTSLLIDGGYSGQPFAEAVQGLLGASVQVAKRHELHTFADIHNVGLWNGHLPDWKSAEDYGRTLNAWSGTIRRCSVSCLL